MDYELIRSSRKTIAIYIRDGRVIVRAPMRTSSHIINGFVESKRRWIEKHRAEQNEQREKRAEFSLSYGSNILYMGRSYRLIEANEKRPTPYFANDGLTLFISAGLDEERLRKKLIAFYKARAWEEFSKRVEYFAPRMGVRPKEMRIGSARRSWGSCSAKKKLTFSWFLIMADPEEIDYVVVHELAHLKHMNHSKAFWTFVGRTMPDWKPRRKKLHALQKRLSSENWS